MQAGNNNNTARNTRAVTASVLAFLLILAVLAYFGTLNEVYTYNHLAGLTALSNDPSMPQDDANVNVIFKATSLSAQNPITVEVRIYPRTGYSPYPDDAWAVLDQTKYIVFPFAKRYPLNPLSDGNFEDAAIELVKKNNSPECFTTQCYFGTGRIMYQFEGNYTFALISNAERWGHFDGEATRWNLDEFNDRLVWQSSYIVNSSDQTALLKNNGITLAMTFILIGFGYIELRKEINPRIVRTLSPIGRLARRIKNFLLKRKSPAPQK